MSTFAVWIPILQTVLTLLLGAAGWALKAWVVPRVRQARAAAQTAAISVAQATEEFKFYREQLKFMGEQLVEFRGELQARDAHIAELDRTNSALQRKVLALELDRDSRDARDAAWADYVDALEHSVAQEDPPAPARITGRVSKPRPARVPARKE